MKKFLFTLVALMMAGSLCAEEYLYIENFEVAQSELGDMIEIPVKAHYDYAVSAWQVDFTFPEGMTLEGAEQGADMTLEYYNRMGKATSLKAPLYNSDENPTRFITAVAEAGYTQDKVAYGCVKWLAGDYDEMLLLYVTVSADFKGGDIVVVTQPSCGEEYEGVRPDVVPCPKGQVNEKVATVTVEGGSVEPEVTATPTINVEDNAEGEYLVISATGDGTVKLYIDGMQVSNPFQYNYQDEEHVITITATAQEEGKEISETATLTYTVPAKAVEPPVTEQTEKPVITSEEDADLQVVHVTATGNGHICLFWDDQLMAEGNGTATWDIPYGEDPEGEEYGVSATAQEEGKLVSDYALATIFVPGKEVTPPAPYQTPAPELTYVVNDDAVVFTATGEGTVTIYINELRAAEPVATGEGTATYTIARGEEDVYVSAWATAQRDEEALVGISESQYVLIPALEQVGPQDPHAEGMWLVLIDKNGEPVYVELTPGQGAQVALDYPTYGGYNAEMDPENPDVRYYFLIDGVRYGAEVEDDVTNMGDMAQTLQNPLVEGENCYVIPTGYNYLIGVYVASDGSMFVMCAQAGFTGIDELVNGKTVAGVRYFNMAGQEMQEANGVTIVVTTYTDGTTTAVKVIK